MRVVETLAVNRALRKAYGIGFCSFEELGVFSRLLFSTLCAFACVNPVLTQLLRIPGDRDQQFPAMVIEIPG